MYVYFLLWVLKYWHFLFYLHSGELFWCDNLFVDEFFLESEEQDSRSGEEVECCARGFVSYPSEGNVGLA